MPHTHAPSPNHPGPLTPDEVAHFREHGYLVMENALDESVLRGLRRQFDAWVAESREQSGAYGEQCDGRPRFSVEPDHCRERPGLRRIASPQELSADYLAVIRDSAAVDAVAQLIGPDIKFNNAKVNAKYPGSATHVDYHQDFLFEPHSNDDLVTVLYFLDDLTPDNGPLTVAPGSHRGPLYSHWRDGVFTGSVHPEVAADIEPRALACHGPAGSACLMHTRLLHGSPPNLSDSPRTLYIVTYSAEDAHPLQANHIPSEQEGEIIRGRASNRVRCSDYQMEFPEYPTGASFFEQQAADPTAEK